MGFRPPFETFNGPTCKGSFILGSACGHCERCAWERSQLVESAPPQPVAAQEKKREITCEMCMEYPMMCLNGDRWLCWHHYCEVTAPSPAATTQQEKDYILNLVKEADEESKTSPHGENWRDFVASLGEGVPAATTQPNLHALCEECGLPYHTHPGRLCDAFVPTTTQPEPKPAPQELEGHLSVLELCLKHPNLSEYVTQMEARIAELESAQPQSR